jgi:hypothetical protein
MIPPVTTKPATSLSTDNRPDSWDSIPVIGSIFQGLDWFQKNTESAANLMQNFFVPGAGAASAGSLGAGAADDIMGYLAGLLQKAGIAIPAFAKGAITNGPMIAQIGDNVGGREVVSPLDDLLDMVSSAVGTAMMNAQQFNGGNKGGGDVVLQIDGTTLARVMQPYSAKENARIGGAMIRATT